MGTSIKVYLKNGDVKEFPHEGRAGGSYTKEIKYEGSFVIIKDEWGKTVTYSAYDIEKVETVESRY